ncbi:hypothetical protein JCM6882_000143, partial [Rhodosporidiobolus microsporus]
MPSPTAPILPTFPTVPPPPHSRAVPIGPSSLPLSPAETAAFAQNAKQLLEKAQQRCAELQRVLGPVGGGAGGHGVEGSGGACEGLRERCSTEDFLYETNRFASNGSFSQDLRTLLRKRWMPVDEGSGPARKRRKRQETEEVEGEAVEGEASGKVEGAGQTQGERKEEGDEDAALKLVSEVEAVGPSFLRGPALRTIEPFLRKTKKPDYNSLSDI